MKKTIIHSPFGPGRLAKAAADAAPDFGFRVATRADGHALAVIPAGAGMTVFVDEAGRLDQAADARDTSDN